MAKIVVIGAGFAGHTTALYLGDELGKSHESTVINKYDYFGNTSPHGSGWAPER